MVAAPITVRIAEDGPVVVVVLLVVTSSARAGRTVSDPPIKATATKAAVMVRVMRYSSWLFVARAARIHRESSWQSNPPRRA